MVLCLAIAHLGTSGVLSVKLVGRSVLAKETLLPWVVHILESLTPHSALNLRFVWGSVFDRCLLHRRGGYGGRRIKTKHCVHFNIVSRPVNRQYVPMYPLGKKYHHYWKPPLWIDGWTITGPLSIAILKLPVRMESICSAIEGAWSHYRVGLLKCIQVMKKRLEITKG